jgi:hypothetical protein
LRQQVWELPEIKPQVTEYPRHRRQGRNTFAFVAAAIQAHFAGRPAVSLLAGA